jgi:osmotically-inducible protein OsmY
MSEQLMITATFHNNPVDDETLAQQVHRALDNIGLSSVSIQVHNGHVMLRGVVPTYSIKAQALHAVDLVPGVQQVRDELLTDFDLEVRIAHAISVDPRTRAAALDIAVNSSNGLLVLAGQVPTYAVAEAAETIAVSKPGVRGVSNRLRIRPQVGTRSEGFAG